MKESNTLSWPTGLRFVLMLLLAIAIGGCRGGSDRDFVAVGLTGVHHMGNRFMISDFYVDGYSGGNVGWEGGGGSNVCCVMLPQSWRPGLTVDVRWSVSDWRNENVEETKRGIYKSITFKQFRAQVPVERYDSPEQLHIHFFPGGRARALTGGGYSAKVQDDPTAAAVSTEGKPIQDLFSQSELEEMDRKAQARAKKYGDWR